VSAGHNYPAWADPCLGPYLQDFKYKPLTNNSKDPCCLIVQMKPRGSDDIKRAQTIIRILIWLIHARDFISIPWQMIVTAGGSPLSLAKGFSP
jgi:hypothetical protein